MGLLDGFEKLINEHGSAVILKERIALANDQYSALSLKLSLCESRVVEIDGENKQLRLSLEHAKVEIQNLKNLTEKSQTYAVPDTISPAHDLITKKAIKV